MVDLFETLLVPIAVAAPAYLDEAVWMLVVSAAVGWAGSRLGLVQNRFALQHLPIILLVIVAVLVIKVVTTGVTALARVDRSSDHSLTRARRDVGLVLRGRS